MGIGQFLGRNQIVVCGALLILSASALAKLSEHANEPRHGLVDDWSVHHAIIARIGPPAAMYAAQSDPRALQAWQRAAIAARNQRLASAIPTQTGSEPEPIFLGEGRRAHPTPPRRRSTHIDWSINLGGAGIAAGMFPAKFTFDVNATPDCTSDFVVFPVNQAPNSTHENLVAFDNLYSGTVPSTGICNRTASASDTGTSATVKWSYGIQSSDGTGIATSPVLSLDGNKVAFVTSQNGKQPRFHVLAWKSGDGVNGSNLQDPAGTTKVISSFSASAPTAGSGTATDLAFGASSGTIGDTLSSPFIDYGHDTAYVGDDQGKLVRIQNVFCTLGSCGGAAPSIDTSWGSSGTVSVACANKLTGPVADLVTGNVFVGCSDGKLYGFDSSGTALANSPLTVGNGGTDGGIVDPPIVDGINGFVYAFAGNSSGTAGVVVQTKIDLSAARTATLGKGGVFNAHAGAFNDAYFSSATSTSWFLYVQGLNGGGTQTFLYWIGFDASRNMNTAITGSINPHAAAECSPLTEFLNGATDRLFFSCFAANALDADNITLVANATPPPPFNPPNPPASSNVAESGGTSGIVVDNVSSSNQASSIYFANLAPSQACGVGGTGRCATKLTQSGLQ